MHPLDGLDPAQLEAVTSQAAPLCILAGAGSGKTRVLTRRVAHRILTGDADAAHALVLTFTRRAAGELRGRLSGLGIRDGVAAGTFHAVAYAQLRRRWADRGERPPVLLERRARVLARLAGPAAPLAELSAEIEWAKARLVSPAHYPTEAAAAGRRAPLPATDVAALYGRYEAEKRRRGLLDFDDLLFACARALESDASFAAAQRWRFRHLFVDEFQDVNPIQFRLLRAWVGGRRDLCVVGDPDQAVYAWNGADPRLLEQFADHFPGASVLRLERNYRSTAEIVRVATAVLASEPGGEGRPGGPVPTVRAYASEREEAAAVARAVRRSRPPGASWSRVAVLARTNAQLVLLEEALRAARIPCRTRGGGLLARPEVRDALAELQRAPDGTPFAARLADLRALAAEQSPGEAGRNLEALLRLAHDYAILDPAAGVEGLAAWLSATVGGDEPSAGTEAVELATFHRAKGLEWPVVFVTGVEHGLVPLAHATTAEAEAEERRLLYVALSRAVEELHVSWAAERSFGGRASRRTPSPWLPLIEQACQALEAAPALEWRDRIAQQRDRLRRVPGTEDGPLLDALHAWRAAAARAASVPAAVIFPDRTLAAVARTRPRTPEQLLAVPGLGPVKAARYGETLLALLAKHAS